MTDEPESPLERRKPSTIPSWVMLGFALGALVMYGYGSNRDRQTPAESLVPVSTTTAPQEPAAANPATASDTYAFADQPSFTVVEALFEQYRGWVFWEDDRTEIALWNNRTLEFSDCFEVLRTSQAIFYRPIPVLTRLPIKGYGPPDSPVLFTESPAQWVARYHQAKGTTPPQAPRPGAIDLPRLPPPPAPRP